MKRITILTVAALAIFAVNVSGQPDRPVPARRTTSARPSDDRKDDVPGTEEKAVPSTAQTWEQKVAQAVKNRQLLAAANVRLQSRRDEIKRWDEAAQERFRRAFATTDAATKTRVLVQIEEMISRNNKLIATITENLRLEFYLRSE